MQIDLRLKTLHDPKSLLCKTVGHTKKKGGKKNNIKRSFSASERQNGANTHCKKYKVFLIVFTDTIVDPKSEKRRKTNTLDYMEFRSLVYCRLFGRLLTMDNDDPFFECIFDTPNNDALVPV